MLPDSPPRTSDSALRRGDEGWAVYGIQKTLNFVAQTALIPDGNLGALTEKEIVHWQESHNLIVDGIAGPRTQQSINLNLCRITKIDKIPDGLARGIVEGEGGYLFGAVNWNVEGGVDCGIVQIRVLGPPFDKPDLSRAFDAPTALHSSLTMLASRAERFKTYDWAGKSWERQLRCGIMSHNWPTGAESIAARGTCPSPTMPCGWLPPGGVKFPDGTPVRSRQDWCDWYAMGSPHGKAHIPKYVTDWS